MTIGRHDSLGRQALGRFRTWLIAVHKKGTAAISNTLNYHAAQSHSANYQAAIDNSLNFGASIRDGLSHE
jgi:hypothetical protein